MNTAVDSFQEYRPLLFSIAYRMTGSASQAEDMVQDTYLRYQQADTTTIHSLKSFLTTIVVNLCLNYLKSAHVQREEYSGIWLPEPLLTSTLAEESPDIRLEQQESISLAFLVLLESLTPRSALSFCFTRYLTTPLPRSLTSLRRVRRIAASSFIAQKSM
ncbi:sigma factor [Dictyobacter kobayashii]|uniref:RNA polymerase sigma-70 region 2 domain-containing protein n=1 Tax=Dictyobacter kobayashii TaxID=2014872 RepID=A0A402AQZ2_9CHLR|nr:sigma factor [Dictyobacter kobayashii]GCE21519.1 hypothetical protein KDK_53190 [Dictyobacter kobayashii]